MTKRRIDPEVRDALGNLPLELPTSLRPEGIPALRALMDGLAAPAPPSTAIELTEHVVPGEPSVGLAMHRPRTAAAARPCIYWIHGGGLISGSYRAGDLLLQRWAEVFDCVCVSVGYRLAPEHPYPAALDDCYAGLRWLSDHADELTVDAERIGVAGRSPGACLAAAVALRARDEGELSLAFQLLTAPMLDDRPTRASTAWDVPTWDRQTNETAWRAYLGDVYGGDVPVYAAPARASDLAGLAPTYVSVGGADLFFDEAVDYACRLVHAGVPTELHVSADGVHGFENLAPGTALAKRATWNVEDWLRGALAPTERIPFYRGGP